MTWTFVSGRRIKALNQNGVSIVHKKKNVDCSQNHNPCIIGNSIW